MKHDPRPIPSIPPSDVRINRLDIVWAGIALGIVGAYFAASLLCALFGVVLPQRVFTFGVLPAELIFLTVGIYTSLLQLLRHRYPIVRVAFGVQLAVLVVLVVHIAVVAGVYGGGALVA